MSKNPKPGGWIGRWRRFKRGCILALIGGVLGIVLACIGLIWLVHKASAQTSAPLDVVLIIDHSNSMWDLNGVGSDPDLLRLDAAELFIAYLGVDTAIGGHRLAAITFGAAAELVAPLTPIDTPAHRDDIRKALANPQRMGWTDPRAALELAYSELFASPRTDPVHRTAVVLLSDGKPEMEGTASPDEKAAYAAGLRALVDRFAAQDCPVFTIALSNAATDADPDIQTVYRNLWQEIAARTPPAEYHQARQSQDLLHIYHAIVARLSGVKAVPPVVDAVVSGATTYHIAVEAGLSRLTLVVFKSSAGVRAAVLRPEGLPLRAGDPDVRYAGGASAQAGGEEVWAVSEPRPGDWRVELDGQGQVIVWKDVIAATTDPLPLYTLALLSPTGRVQGEHPVEIAARLTDANGQPVSGAGVQVMVELRRAGFVEATALAADDGQGCDAQAGDGVWSAAVDLPPGVYTVHAHALRDGRTLARWESAFEIAPLPAPTPSPTWTPFPTPTSTAMPTPTATPRPQPTFTISPSPTPGPAQTEKPPRRWVWPLVGGTVIASGAVGAGVWRLRARPLNLQGQLRVVAAPEGLPAGYTLDLSTLRGIVAAGSETLPLRGETPSKGPLFTLHAARDSEGYVETVLKPALTQGDGITVNGMSVPLSHALWDGDLVAVDGWTFKYQNLAQAARRRPGRNSPFHSFDDAKEV